VKGKYKMAKKKNRRPRQKAKSQGDRHQSKKTLNFAITSIIAFGVLLVAAGIPYFKDKPAQSTIREQVRPANSSLDLMEKKPTLSPDLFFGSVRKAYTIAREIPEILDQLYCYCRCRENFNHLTLLTCYTDKHAST